MRKEKCRQFFPVLMQMRLQEAAVVLLVAVAAGLLIIHLNVHRLPGFAERCMRDGGCSQKGTTDPCYDLPVDDKKGRPRRSNGELVLVTGASGFIGSHLTAMLLDLGYKVRAFDNLETGNILYLDLRHPNLEFQYGDILELSAMRKAMEGVTGVFHLAAASKVLPSLKDPHMATFNVEKNALGTGRVLEVVNETKAVRKVVYAASSTYYGNQPIPFAETDPFMPTSPYAASKYMGELQMQTNDGLYGLPTLSLRFFMVYGPRNPAEGAYAIVTGKFLKRAQEGKPLLIEGTGENFRDFVHVKDIARACILGLQSPVHGLTINVGSGEAYSVKQVANLVSSNQEHVAARKNDLKGTLANTCQARKLLNFKTNYDFETVMREMIADANAGRSDYFAPIWKDEQVLSAMEQKLPGWKASPSVERSKMIKAALDSEPSFLDEFLKSLN
mmetsp:Transcript_105399/g.183319  ORF Transcript_105399/g.183319 Transcript_105399/m.183319 type:complete len:444 (+) Transcript_105399:136-1467(+)